MHRFFLEGIRITPGSEVDLAALHHQLWRVLRLRTGDPILLLDNKGGAFACDLTSVGPTGATGHISDRISVVSEPRVQVTLYQCLIKGDKFEWVLQKGTELGVSRFVPVISRRTIVQSSTAVQKKYDRWRTIIREAAEQCGRRLLPILDSPVELATALQAADGCCLVPWEEANAAKGILTELNELTAHDADLSQISMLIGPEGGIAADEVAVARQAGWRVVTLGPRVLRAETAALVAVALVMGWAHELGV